MESKASALEESKSTMESKASALEESKSSTLEESQNTDSCFYTQRGRNLDFYDGLIYKAYY
ncbi:MAG: hypothetical protein DRR08_10340 [Candidatus Parabeggiatoa sp. nov. 2]|nr:MAG: hypothetical protein B6247_16470 [Beggiatoa sp. 4572_84]RKZ60813.1 MAG: hypothetical protein DRR08_10340 [Gammaproteobacteria bacterium]